MMRLFPISKPTLPAPIALLFLLLTATALPVFGSGGAGARFVHVATTSNITSNYTLVDHPLTDGSPSKIVHATQTWSPFGDPGVFNADAIGVWYSDVPGAWSIFNQNTGDAMPVGAAFNVWVPPNDGTSFVHTSSSGNHTTTIDNPLTNGNPDAILIVTQNFNPGGGTGTFNNHVVSVYYSGLGVNKWTIFNQDIVALPTGASFNVTVLDSTSNAFIHTANSGNISLNSTVIDNPLTNGKPNAILVVTQNWTPGAISNPHPVGVWYDGAQWTIVNEDSVQMPDGAAFNVSVLPEVEGVAIHHATAATIELSWSEINHPLLNANPDALAFVTQNFNPDAVFNPSEIGIWYTGSRWAAFNQDLSAMPVDARFNVVIPPADSMTFLHVADTDNISSRTTTIEYPPLDGHPDAIFHVAQNFNPSNVGDIYNDHPLGVVYASGNWKIINEDVVDMPVGAAFNVWIPPTNSSTFVHTATSGNTAGNSTYIDNVDPGAALIVTQRYEVGVASNAHPIGVWYDYLSFKWAIFNEDGAAMPIGAAFNVTVKTPTFIFSSDFETGDTSLWSTVVP